MAFLIETYGLSDVGCIRELNEDCFCVHGFEGGDRGYCILADGMGGHNAGEVASQNTVRIVAEELKKVTDDSSEKGIPARLNAAIAEANDRVHKMSVESSAHSGMGTTVVAAFIADGTAYVANVGDSRAYVYSSSGLKQLTTDHSVVEELVRTGTITRAEARKHPQKNIITRAVGTDSTVAADLFEYEYSAGDKLILCSDGLCAMVDDDEICRIVGREKTPEKTVNKLINAAKKNGGLDNITVICIRFV